MLLRFFSLCETFRLWQSQLRQGMETSWDMLDLMTACACIYTNSYIAIDMPRRRMWQMSFVRLSTLLLWKEELQYSLWSANNFMWWHLWKGTLHILLIIFLCSYPTLIDSINSSFWLVEYIGAKRDATKAVAQLVGSLWYVGQAGNHFHFLTDRDHAQTKRCRCGQSKKLVQCCQPYLCEKRCGKDRNCGRHQCKKKCCQGNCPPCEEVLWWSLIHTAT